MTDQNRRTVTDDERRLTALAEGKRNLSAGKSLDVRQFDAMIKEFQEQIVMALPKHLKDNADKYARVAMTLYRNNDKLQQCDGMSVLSSIMTASALGLDLTPQLGQCYVLPYYSKRQRGFQAQFQIGYRGAVALAYRSDQVLRFQGEIQRKGDAFDYELGINARLSHRPGSWLDRGDGLPPIEHVYAVANLRNGGYAFRVWTAEMVVEHAKRFSKDYYKYRENPRDPLIENPNSIWAKDFDAMARKTLILALWKELPISTELQMAAMLDNSTVRGSAAAISDIEREDDILTVTAYEYDAGEDEEPEPEDEKPKRQRRAQQRDRVEVQGETITAEAVTVPEPRETDFAQDSPAPQPDETFMLQSTLLDLIGTDSGLGLNADEQAKYVRDKTGKVLGDLSVDELKRLIDAVKVDIEEMEPR